MMSKTKSPFSRGWRVLWLLPLVCLGVGLQAQVVYDKTEQKDRNLNDNNEIRIHTEGTDPLFILRQAWGEEKEITRKEFNKLQSDRIQSMEVLKDAYAKAKYGEKGANGVIIITLKKPQELDGIIVMRYGRKNGDSGQAYLPEPDTMPTFQGEDMNSFSKWLNSKIMVPEGCKHSGTMKVGFVVAEDGTVKDVQILESVCGELDAMMLDLVAKSPKWEPATSGGRPVAQYLTVPVAFKFQ